jgi:hypothetical protein
MPASAIWGIVLVILVIIWLWKDERNSAEDEDNM